jgi:hypothetical protein
MKIVIENIKFDFNIGCKLLKLKHEGCPTHLVDTYVAEIWDEIIPTTFAEIAAFANVEQRRVGMFCLGMERLISQVNPTLMDEQTISKTTTWINSKGEMETLKFEDTYKLFMVSKTMMNPTDAKNHQMVDDCYFVKFKDTSTDREYMLWVALESVKNTNGITRWNDNARKVTALDCIAWSIQTNIRQGNIEKIVRQGDCILIKPKKKDDVGLTRHITSEEYMTLLVAES